MIIRLYTGEDGQAHFEDLNVPAGETETVALKPGGDMTFRSFPDGSFSDWHTGPRRQYVIVLSGQMEIGIGDGTKRVLNPGWQQPGERDLGCQPWLHLRKPGGANGPDFGIEADLHRHG